MMKKQKTSQITMNNIMIFHIVTVILFFNNISTLKAETINEINHQDTVKNQKNKYIFEDSQQMPEFPGGQDALMKWLGENLIYPKDAVKQDIQGQVVTKFIVRHDGSLGEVGIIKSLHPSCDKEAIRLIKTMPKWIPGKQGGEPVSTYFYLPVRFRIQKKVYDSVEVMPQFPGGNVALAEWLTKNVTYPKEAQSRKITGKVIMQFVVTADGSIEDIEVLKSVHPLLDREAIWATKRMPKWIPGKHNDKPVYVFFTLPINFRLRGDKIISEK